jgi:cell division control protein 24
MLLPTLGPDPPSPIPIEFPDFDYPEGNGVFTWATLPQNVKSCKKGAAKFIVKLTELQRNGQWPQEDELWAVHELLGDDTSGLMKVLRTVNLLLDRLPESAWIREDESPSTPFGNSVPTSLGENSHLRNAEDAFANMGISSADTTPMPGQSGRSVSNNATPTMHRVHSSSVSHGSNYASNGVAKGGRPPAPLTINTTMENHVNAMSRTGSGTHHYSFPAGPPSGIDVGPVDVGGAAMHVWEILKTEKKYVAELEIMQVRSDVATQPSVNNLTERFRRHTPRTCYNNPSSLQTRCTPSFPTLQNWSTFPGVS